MPSYPKSGDVGGVVPGTRAAAVAAALRDMILSGELPTGTPLRQVEISDRFGVSTTPVREAFTALAREGLVQKDDHRGVKVILPSIDDLRENYEMRMALEPLAVEKAVDHLDAALLERLSDQTRAMEAGIKATKPGGETARLSANRDFHRALYAAARRPKLSELIEQLRNSADVYLSIVTARKPSPKYRAQAVAEHWAIVSALENHDGAAAALAMREHLQHNFDHLSKSLVTLIDPGE